MRDHHLRLSVHSGLGVVALHEAVLGLEDAAVGVGEVALGSTWGACAGGGVFLLASSSVSGATPP